MDDPHELCASSKLDHEPVLLVLEAGRAVLLDPRPDLEGRAVVDSGVLQPYLDLMTHPALLEHTALRQVVAADSEEGFYGWFDAQGRPVTSADERADYRFDVAAYRRSLEAQWRTDGCVMAELRRDDERRGYVSIQLKVRAALGAVRGVAEGELSHWRIEPVTGP